MIKPAHRLLLAMAFGALATAAVYTIPPASAQPGCTAAALSSALGQVSSGTGAWLSSHPEANDVITSVGESGNRDAVRVYFQAHPGEWAELQGIASPLRTLRAQCGGDGAAKAAGIGDLFNAMAS